MNKFHQIPTDKFVPVSHENSYLFTQYDKISNFLAFELDQNYKYILAKPVKNDLTYDWYSVYEELVIVDENEENENVIAKYWNFKDKIDNKIKSLSRSDNENSRNWASLLIKTFNHQDNFIFSNGNDICIVWGWKFENKNLERPVEKIVIEYPKSENLVEDIEIIKPHDHIVGDNNVNDNIDDVQISRNNLDSIQEEHEIEEETETNESGFVKFLKWISSKFWWLLFVLSILIIIILLFKSCNYDDDYNKMNLKLIQLEQKANNCCN